MTEINWALGVWLKNISYIANFKFIEKCVIQQTWKKSTIVLTALNYSSSLSRLFYVWLSALCVKACTVTLLSK